MTHEKAMKRLRSEGRRLLAAKKALGVILAHEQSQLAYVRAQEMRYELAWQQAMQADR